MSGSYEDDVTNMCKSAAKIHWQKENNMNRGLGPTCEVEQKSVSILDAKFNEIMKLVEELSAIGCRYRQMLDPILSTAPRCKDTATIGPGCEQLGTSSLSVQLDVLKGKLSEITNGFSKLLREIEL